MTADVKLFASERFGDAPNSGGRITNTVIVDGVVNNAFSNIPEGYRVSGHVNIVKLYVKADTGDTALYQDMGVMIDREPQDPAVSCVLFSDASWTSLRTDEEKYIQSYLTPGPISRLVPYDKQAKGQRAGIFFQDISLPLPDIGSVIFFDDGTNVQPVRISSISNAVQKFTDGNGDYFQNIITLGFNQKLLYTFLGIAIPPRISVSASTLIRTSIVADSASYFGITKLANDLTASTMTVPTNKANVTTIFAPLVPSNSTGTSITGASPAQAKYLVPSSSVVTVVKKIPTAPHTVYLGRSFAPGSMTLVYEDVPGSTTNLHGTYVDKGDGTFTKTSGTSLFNVTADYFAGTVTADGAGFPTPNPSYTQISFTLKFAAAVTRQSFTMQTPITESTRDNLYNATLNPFPAPGTLVVSYQTSGKWYDLADDGTGVLSGTVGTGGGSTRYDSGNTTVTLGALPDIGSAIIYSWGITSDYEIRTGDVTIQPPAVAGQLGHAANPSSVSITWTSGGVTKTATDNGSGALSGDGAGTIQYSKLSADGLSAIGGSFTLRPTLLPDKTATYAVAYNDTSIAATQTTVTPTQSGGHLTFTVPGSGSLKPGGLSLWLVMAYAGSIFRVNLYDNGVGGFFGDAAGDQLATGTIITGATINYTTRAVSVPDNYSIVLSAASYAAFQSILPSRLADGTSLQYVPTQTGIQTQSGSATAAVTISYFPSSVVTLSNFDAGGSTRSQTDSFAAPPLTIDLTPTVSSPVVPGCVSFSFGGSTYVDRSSVLYRNIDPATNAGTIAGTFDPVSGTATITDWTPGASPALTIQSLLVQPGQIPTTVTNGRAPGNPLRPASYYIQARRYSDNVLISATADANGNITSTDMHGHVNTQTGVYNVAWGAYVLDSALTTGDKAQPWYNPANVGGDGYIFRPAPVNSSTISYNCVINTFLPQNPLLLGLDPTQLPLDGRVRIVDVGNQGVFHEETIFTFPGGLTSGQVVNVGLTNLRAITLYDHVGVLVANPAGAKYTAALATGLVTMGASLDLSAYTQPLVATLRWEDVVLVTDAEIGGGIQFTPSLTHAYSAANGRFSTILQYGDKSANLLLSFVQGTWLNQYLDAPVGSPITPDVNLRDYPVEVLNRDCEELRVAYIFTSSTGGNIAIEGEGVIGTFTTATNSAPLNLAGNPLWVFNHLAWGTGWATGNVWRGNYIGAGGPVQVVRTTLQAAATANNDAVTLMPRWSKS